MTVNFGENELIFLTIIKSPCHSTQHIHLWMYILVPFSSV